MCYVTMASREKNEMPSAEYYYRKAVEAYPAVSVCMQSHTHTVQA